MPPVGGSLAGEGPGTEIPSPAGHRGGCAVEGCERASFTRGWCAAHYKRWHRNGDLQAHKPIHKRGARPARIPAPALDREPFVLVCPKDFEGLVAELVENDARPIFRLLWRAIGEWHLAGLLEEEAS